MSSIFHLEFSRKEGQAGHKSSRQPATSFFADEWAPIEFNQSLDIRA